MRTSRIVPTGTIREFGSEEIIVSKTDLKGIIRYTNEVFSRVAGYSREELIGSPHSLIRHPDMPGGVFRYLWQRIESGHEVFALVKNLCKDGAGYWVLAHVTPSFDRAGHIVGYHSNRRRPEHGWISAIEPLYARMRAIESGHQRPAVAAEASLEALGRELADLQTTYDAYIWQLIRHRDNGVRAVTA